MDRTADALAEVLSFAAEMSDEVKRVDAALPPLRRLLAAAGVTYRLVGGVAVVHHGYVRTTRDVDVLVGREALDRLDAHLVAHGFERLSPRRLRHRTTGVDVDLLVSGEQMPRPGSPPYPSPGGLAGSASDPAYVALPGLLELKLHAGRHQDLADVVALLKPLDDGEYVHIEAAMPPALRQRLAQLRDDALEERSWDVTARPQA